jgi:hypothetical protein
VANGRVWSWRNLVIYVPVVLATYGLTGATVDAITGERTGQSFVASAGLWVAVGWWVPGVFLPAALILLALASWLPERWSVGRRRVVLLLAAPILFAAAMWAAASVTSGNVDILTSAYLAVVVVPAIAYAVVLRFGAA